MSVNPNTSASSGGGDDGVLPSWFPTSFSGFRNLVVGIVSSWFVAGFLDVGISIVDSILVVLEAIESAAGAVAGGLDTIGREILTVPWLLWFVVDDAVVSIASTTGPAAPFIVPVLWVGAVVVLLAAIRATISVVRTLVGVLPFT